MEELSVSFGLHFNMSPAAELEHQLHSHLNHEHCHHDHDKEEEVEQDMASPIAASRPPGLGLARARGRSLACLSAAALGANATLANTSLGNGVIGEAILPGLDSPMSFRPLTERSPSYSHIESLICSSSCSLSSSPQPTIPKTRTTTTTTSTTTTTTTTSSSPSACASQRAKLCSIFLDAADAQTAGGAAGEDRIQAVCSQQDGWIFCGIYDGFNGRDAADFLAGTLYKNISLQLQWKQGQQDEQEHGPGQQQQCHSHSHRQQPTLFRPSSSSSSSLRPSSPTLRPSSSPSAAAATSTENSCVGDGERKGFEQGVLRSLERALEDAEASFMAMAEKEMDERPDLAMVGSCVLVVLLYGSQLYTMNMGDSRAVLATVSKEGELGCLQLSQDHVLSEASERGRVLAQHPDDPSTIVSSRVKGRIKLTRAFGAGYLKKTELNEKLMGLLRVPNLMSPPYVSSLPHVDMHKVSMEDVFVVMGSDGLFDFFTNEEVVKLLHNFIGTHPHADPAKYILDELLIRAASKAGITREHLKAIPIGRKRIYHDDVTVMVLTIGVNQKMTSASTTS